MDHIDSTASETKPVGVFDSGLGGLTVVRAMRRQLPAEQLLYLGDTARVPYGTKSADTVVRYALQIGDFLLAHSVKYVVVACNTASAHALPALRDRLSVPVMGVVEPGARAAARLSRTGQVGVLATLGTVDSEAYQREMQKIRPDLSVFSQPCPLLVPLAEEGWVDHPATEEIVRHYLLELRTQAGDIDVLLLGCTHYPLLREPLARHAQAIFDHPVTLVDSAEATASAVSRDLAGRGLLSSARAAADQFMFTDVSRFREVAVRFLGQPIEHAERADI